MKRRLVDWSLLLSTLALLSSPLCADDAVYFGDGYHVYPIGSSDLQLLAETIVISDRRRPTDADGSCHIDVDMTFRNQGPDTSVQMGFPVLVSIRDETENEIDIGFRTWVDGQPVTITKKKGVPNPRLKDLTLPEEVYAYTVSFKSGETKQIKHSYAVGGTVDSMAGWQVTYVLRTGALWKGGIGQCAIEYRMPLAASRHVVGFTPREQDLELVGDELRFFWRYKDLKPRRDFAASGGGDAFPLIKRTVAEDMRDIKMFYQGMLSTAELRYARNKVYAAYGFPFKNPFVRAQFYYPGSPYKENPSFSERQISAEHAGHVRWLTQMEQERERSEAF